MAHVTSWRAGRWRSRWSARASRRSRSPTSSRVWRWTGTPSAPPTRGRSWAPGSTRGRGTSTRSGSTPHRVSSSSTPASGPSRRSPRGPRRRPIRGRGGTCPRSTTWCSPTSMRITPGVRSGEESRRSRTPAITCTVADRAHFAHADDAEDYVARRAMERLEELGMLSLEEADVEIIPGVRVLHTPGHTPGHRSVVLADGDETLLITGDALHHPAQVRLRDRPSSHDEDPESGARSRKALLDRAEATGVARGRPALRGAVRDRRGRSLARPLRSVRPPPGPWVRRPDAVRGTLG